MASPGGPSNRRATFGRGGVCRSDKRSLNLAAPVDQVGKPVARVYLAPVIHTAHVRLPPGEVLGRAKAFFVDRVPHMAAFIEKEGPGFVVLRGQGGEEVAISATAVDGGSRVRASTLFFDQAVDSFLTTLPLESDVEVA